MFPPPRRESNESFAWSGYVQIRYTGMQDRDDMLSLRRRKLMAGGLISPRVQWYIQSLFKDGNESPTDDGLIELIGWRGFPSRHRISGGRVETPVQRSPRSPSDDRLHA